MNDTTITVKTARVDDYGNLWVMPVGGEKDIKIGEKRKHLHELFQVGNSVKLHYDTYLNKTYVADAELVSEAPTAVKEAQKLGAELKSVLEKPKAYTPDPKNRSYALSYAKDIAVAQIEKGEEMAADKVVDIAKRFTHYMDTGE